MADSKSAPEVKLDLPITPGPYAPTWESIEKNYPGTPAWLREAKFGIWVHFGPQAAGKSGDWYARNLYKPGSIAYKNHLANYGHPSEVGYKEVLRDWNPAKLDPAKLVETLQRRRRPLPHHPRRSPRPIRHVGLQVSALELHPPRPQARPPRRMDQGRPRRRHPLRRHLPPRILLVVVADRLQRRRPRRPQTRRPLRRPPHPRRRQGQVVGRPRPTTPLRRRSPRIQRRRQSRQHRLEPPARRHLSKPRRLRQVVCHLVGSAHDGRRR